PSVRAPNGSLRAPTPDKAPVSSTVPAPTKSNSSLSASLSPCAPKAYAPKKSEGSILDDCGTREPVPTRFPSISETSAPPVLSVVSLGSRMLRVGSTAYTPNVTISPRSPSSTDRKPLPAADMLKDPVNACAGKSTVPSSFTSATPSNEHETPAPVQGAPPCGMWLLVPPLTF